MEAGAAGQGAGGVESRARGSAVAERGGVQRSAWDWCVWSGERHDEVAGKLRCATDVVLQGEADALLSACCQL
jgi:hypothetical protein